MGILGTSHLPKIFDTVPCMFSNRFMLCKYVGSSSSILVRQILKVEEVQCCGLVVLQMFVTQDNGPAAPAPPFRLPVVPYNPYWPPLLSLDYWSTNNGITGKQEPAPQYANIFQWFRYFQWFTPLLASVSFAVLPSVGMN